MKLLENALSSLLLCESTLQHHQPQHEAKQTSDEVEDSLKENMATRESGESVNEVREEAVEGEESDALVSLVLHRLLGVLKQLVAAAMKKRYVFMFLHVCGVVGIKDL